LHYREVSFINRINNIYQKNNIIECVVISMEVFEVGISGYGPAGAIAALALAKQGIHVVLLEKEKDLYPLPRAIALDNEILRLFALLDIPIENGNDFVPTSTYQFSNHKDELLFGIDRGPRDPIDFRSKTSLFRQPEFEKNVREIIKSEPLITVYLGEELLDFSQAEYNVFIKTSKRQLQVQYLLGCDGARSTVRKLSNIPLIEQINYEEPWLIVDALVHNPENSSEITQQICNPERAISYIPRPGTNNRRWEIQIKDTDNKSALETESFIQPILSRWLEPHEYEIERTAVYTFRALEAERWRDNRIFLLGDAAHMMPPFLGQGLSSGVRDAINISWKVAHVLKGNAHPSILESYELERKEHVRIITFIAILLGKILMMKGKRNVAIRNSIMSLLHKLPPTSNKIDHLHFDVPKMHDYLFTMTHAKQFKGQRLKNAEICLDGKIILLDHLLKLHFGFITFGKHIPKVDESLLPEVQHIHIIPQNARKQFAVTTTVIVEDFTGVYESYFKQLNTNGLIVRPDKYILGTIEHSKKFSSILIKGTKYPDISTLPSPSYNTLLKHVMEEEKENLKGPLMAASAVSALSIASYILLRKRGK
jgi:3-(3-hydroxy-phenyl)propionate hydroxylase